MVEEIYENELPDLVKKEEGRLGRWMYVDDAADWLNVSHRTIYQYLKENRLKGIKTRGRRLISVGSVLWFQLEQKSIELRDLKNKETARETLFHVRSIKN